MPINSTEVVTQDFKNFNQKLKKENMKGLTWDKINQLRERVSDVAAVDKRFCYDFYLHGWLMHMNMKVDRTEAAIREGMKWRKENNIDILADQTWASWAPGIAEAIIMDTDIVTKNGTPVMTFSADTVDFRALFEAFGKEAVLRYYFQWLVKLEQAFVEDNLRRLKNKNNNKNKNKKGRIIESEYNNGCCQPQFTPAPILIVSYKNFSLWNATSIDLIQNLMELVRVGMNYFPMPVSRVYVINMNKFSSCVYKVLKPILQAMPITIECFGTDKPTWTKALLEEIDEDQLIPYFGGTRKEKGTTTEKDD